MKGVARASAWTWARAGWSCRAARPSPSSWPGPFPDQRPDLQAQGRRRRLLAYRLEAEIGKKEILELYLNRIFFGAGAYGVEAAAQTYFAKPARELTLSEAGLAGRPAQGAVAARADQRPGRALDRSHLILAAMRDEGWISAADEQAALGRAAGAGAALARAKQVFGYLLDMAAAEAAAAGGGQAPDLVVELSIDPALQTQAAGDPDRTLDQDAGRRRRRQGGAGAARAGRRRSGR